MKKSNKFKRESYISYIKSAINHLKSATGSVNIIIADEHLKVSKEFIALAEQYAYRYKKSDTATAPELLNALEKVLPCIDGNDEFWWEIDLLKKVIKKAKGEL